MDGEQWDRQPDEGSQAYAAFCAYRDAGPSRSLDRTYRRAKGISSPNQQASGRWKEWYRAWDWKARVAAYDVHLELKARHKREHEHQKLLKAHLDRQRVLATANIELATMMLQKAHERLAGIKIEEIEIKHLPAFVRAAAAVADAGTNAESQALAVDQLVGAADD